MDLALPVTLGDALQAGRSLLKQSGVPEPGLEAGLLLAHALGSSRAWVLAHPGDRLSPAVAACYLAFVQRRCLREPTAYITGRKAWWDVELAVDRNVLIPRPETEIMAALAIGATRRLQAPGPVVDVGTGSGALAIAIARAVPAATVYALDVSRGALRTAQRNSEQLAPGRVQVLEGDLATNLPEAARVVVANLPYIPSQEIAGLAPELAYEPRLALDGGADGLGPISALLAQLGRCAVPPAVVLLECGHDQAAVIGQMARGIWPAACVDVHQDLARLDRVVDIRPDGQTERL